MTMQKKTALLSLLLAVLALCLSAASLVIVCQAGHDGKTARKNIQYVMYLGTNDKATNRPVFSQEEAKARAETILLRHFGGYTVQEAKGGWIDGGKVYREYTLVIYLSDTDLAKVHAAADEMLRVFAQSSVLIQANETTTEFYAGRH